MKRILVVEDDPIIGFDLCELLSEVGFTVYGPAPTVAEGLRLIAAHNCDTAVLDVNLGRETSEAIALELARRGIPFITLSGYAADQHPSVFKGAPLLLKPVKISRLIGMINSMSSDVTRNEN
jgi:DNA-binding response OmpR family regulator